MLFTLLTGLALTIGQPNPGDSQPAAESEPAQSTTTETERWLLMKMLQGTCVGPHLDSHRIEISGWTDMSFTASSARFNQLPMGFNNRANEFLLQQDWLRIDRPVLTKDATAPSFGFRSDWILPGSDYRYTLAHGIFNSQLTANNGKPNLYGIDPIQFYAEAYFPGVCSGLDIKLGRMYTQFGFESNEAISNQLVSHAYTFIYDPFTQTGLMGTLKLNDTWSVQTGMILGSDMFISSAASPTGMASVKWAPPKGCDTFAFSCIVGSGRFHQEQNFYNPEIFDFMYTHKFNSRWSYSFETLYGCMTNVPDIGFANWLGVINYLTCEFSPKVSGTTRMEFFEDFEGQRTGHRGLYNALTSGLTFRPRRDILIRSELRYDYNGDSRPFENRHGLFTASTDLIFRW